MVLVPELTAEAAAMIVSVSEKGPGPMEIIGPSSSVFKACGLSRLSSSGGWSLSKAVRNSWKMINERAKRVGWMLG